MHQGTWTKCVDCCWFPAVSVPMNFENMHDGALGTSLKLCQLKADCCLWSPVTPSLRCQRCINLVCWRINSMVLYPHGDARWFLYLCCALNFWFFRLYSSLQGICCFNGPGIGPHDETNWMELGNCYTFCGSLLLSWKPLKCLMTHIGLLDEVR